ncbi:MAG: 1-acyl-sn-glycerol-3-phosphate acyltransferase [Deltaproteobacteria bacterium]|nr:1-acyl-sn-glycerol-3-phosphate acyltransferase [Deltaproteobacteria bacterium]
MTSPRVAPAPPRAASGGAGGAPAHHSAMVRRFGLLPRLFTRLAFQHVRVDPADIDRLRRLASEGTLVYVMRYRSLVDYFLVNYVLLREGLPLPRFANGISSLWLRPLRDLLGMLWTRLKSAHLFGKEVRQFRERDLVGQLAAHGRSVLLFIRSRRGGMGRARASVPPTEMRRGSDYLREIVHSLWGKEQPVFLVPLAIFRGSGLRRKGSRLASFVYSVHEAPSDVKRLFTYVWNTRDLTISFGAEIPLNAFIAQYQSESEDRIVRRLTRALQIFLYREERVVWGPTLRSKRQVRDMVLGADEVQALVCTLAAERKVSEEKVAKEARAYFDEMAANFHGYYLAILAFLFRRIWQRTFSGLEIRGLERVVECVKQHPIVLVPCHRSHFDYLILTYIFHENFLSPPHIAAGINMAFWPMGPFFRGAGAYFIRRTFDDNPLYKTVFRKYLEYLIREGYTQEFFIEGGRSRTGKILTPKLGMLSAIVNAFVEGVRRDLYLVPVSIHYGRIVEEEAYKQELLGGQKEKESFGALLKARRILRQKYGTAYVTFAPPISLNDALGSRKERFHEPGATIEDEKRYFVQKLGFRLLREVNDVAVAGATSLSSTVLLSAPQQAIRYGDFVTAGRALTALLVARNVTLTASLQRNTGDFLESLRFLQSGKLIEWMKDRAGDIIYAPPEKRMILDFYKNNIIHFFLVPSLVAHALRRDVLRTDALVEEVWWWLELFRWEFALPERAAAAAEIDTVLAYFRAAGAIGSRDVRRTHPLLVFGDGILENFREAYWIVAKTLLDLDADGLSQKTAIARMQKSFLMHQLLGQAQKPEGNSAITFENAVNRLAEIGCVTRARRGRGGKEQAIMPGRAFAELAALERRLGDSLSTDVPGRPWSTPIDTTSRDLPLPPSS